MYIFTYLYTYIYINIKKCKSKSRVVSFCSYRKKVRICSFFSFKLVKGMSFYIHPQPPLLGFFSIIRWEEPVIWESYERGSFCIWNGNDCFPDSFWSEVSTFNLPKSFVQTYLSTDSNISTILITCDVWSSRQEKVECWSFVLDTDLSIRIFHLSIRNKNPGFEECIEKRGRGNQPF